MRFIFIALTSVRVETIDVAEAGFVHRCLALLRSASRVDDSGSMRVDFVEIRFAAAHSSTAASRDREAQHPLLTVHAGQTRHRSRTFPASGDRKIYNAHSSRGRARGNTAEATMDPQESSVNDHTCRGPPDSAAAGCKIDRQLFHAKSRPDNLGLRDRRRGLGRLRAREPALRRRPSIQCCCSKPGPPDRYPWIHIPIGYAKTMFHPVYNWCFKTEPDPGMNGREVYWPRGRTLGGSSAINGLIYIRGQREDYDHWAALGNPGLGLRRRPPVLPQARAQRPRRKRMAWRGRAALGVGHRREARIDRSADRGRRRDRHTAQRRLQRRDPGRGRLLPADDATRVALLDRRRVSASGAIAAQSRASRPKPTRRGFSSTAAGRRASCTGRAGATSPSPRGGR